MLFLLSPAKKIVCNGLDARFEHTTPRHLAEAGYLVAKLKKKSPKALKDMMGISDDLAALNQERFQLWSAEPEAEESMQAALLFQGDVYQGLEASSFSIKKMAYAQSHVRILSGLYGILKPLDQIMPYRLEMGSSFKVTAAKQNLYQFWADSLQQDLAEELKSQDEPVIVNLASKEYSRAAKLKGIEARLIQPEFKEGKDGSYKMVSFFAKKARGMMARYAVEQGISKVEDLKSFDLDGYYFNNSLSEGDKWVFTRN